MTLSDLSPDALAELEAKLVADLDMVRKVRALLLEHRSQFSAASPTPVPASAVSSPVLTAPMVTAPPPVPARSRDDILTDALIALADQPFAPKDLASAAAKALRNYPESSIIKTYLNRMIRKGHVVIVETRTGRNGSLYRSTLPQPAAETPPSVSDSTAA